MTLRYLTRRYLTRRYLTRRYLTASYGVTLPSAMPRDGMQTGPPNAAVPAGPPAVDVADRVINVAAVDDHPVVLSGIAGWLTAGGEGVRVVATAATVDDLLAGPGRDAQVVLLDLQLHDGTDVERNVRAIRVAGPAVLVLSVFRSPAPVRSAMRAGAAGYILKSEDSAVAREAIRAVAAGEAWMSPALAYILRTDDAEDLPALSVQEKRTLELYATGLPMKSVARRMAISEETAKKYISRVKDKYARAGRAAHTKVELYRRAIEDGHISPPENGGPPEALP